MATFTMYLHEVLEIEGDTGNGFRIGMDRYPIFDEAWRIPLNKKIIAHYWNREIGLETIPQFTFNLRRKMMEVMPYYNKLFLSERIVFDPLATFDLQTIANGTTAEQAAANSASSNSSNSHASGRSMGSDTPQTMLSEDEDYASSGNESDSDSTAAGTASQQSTSNNTGSRDTTSSTKGFQGAASDLLTKYRDTLLNIDMNVVNECNELFMGVWDNAVEFLPSFGRPAFTGYFGGYS